MRDGAVVALEEVLGADLPVRFVLEVRTREKAERVDVDAGFGDALRNLFEKVGERRCVEIRVDEDERAPGVELEGDEAEALLDPAFAVRARCGDQLSVEGVGPRVVGALERLALARALADNRATVAADVDEGSQGPFAVA